MTLGRMNLRRAFCGLILPAILGASPADPALAAPGRSKTYNYTGSVSSFCKIGTSTSYAISIVIAMTTGSNRSATIKIDSTTGTAASSNGSTTTATQTYSAVCNPPGGQTLHLNAPRSQSGANTYNYSVVVKDATANTVATANTTTANPATASVPIPQTSSNWTIAVSASVPPNGTPVGTYTATMTIQ